jgi:aspartate/methionine/tyrosine aminotransferase
MTAKRTRKIEPFHVMRLLARARELEAAGRDIIHMEIGEPDFVTVDPIIEAGHKALNEGKTHYTPALGLPELRHALSDWYARVHNALVDAGRIIVTPGSSTGLQMLMSALVDPGEEVLLPDPGYPCNRNFVLLSDGVPVSLPLSEEQGWLVTPEMVEHFWSDKTRALLVASPANPTGAVYTPQELEALHDAVAAKGGYLIVDEIYQGLTYEVESSSSLLLRLDHLIVVDSFSKYFGMTGWRVGWLVVPESLVPVLEVLAQNIYLSAPVISQWAAITALSAEVSPLLEERRDIFRERRDFLYPGLKQLGFGVSHPPHGAFYLYANCAELTDDSFDFCQRLLEELGVAVTPGKDFGLNKPHEYVRFAFTTSIERMQEAIERIGRFIQ